MFFDIAIIGGGISGASLAHFLGASRSVLVLEREAHHGYHSSGRSAAEFSRIHHGPLIGKLARASAEFLTNAPDGFADIPLIKVRGNLVVAGEDKAAHLHEIFQLESRQVENLRLCSTEECLTLVPFLNPGQFKAAFFDPSCCDIEAQTLLQGYVRSARHSGAEIRTSCELLSAAHDGKVWRLKTSQGEFSATTVVNASGAWADNIAALFGAKQLGLVPYRRTVITVDVPPEIDLTPIPEVNEVDEAWYFKPDAGRLLVSPADATPSEPCDAQPEDIDIAYAAYYLEEATKLQVKSVASKWAGLRTFSPDRLPVVGLAGDVPGYFWLAGQGGSGIQSSPALGQYAANLLRQEPLDESLHRAGLTGAEFLPVRFD